MLRQAKKTDVSVRDSLWLMLYETGERTVRQIADMSGLTPRRVYQRLERARLARKTRLAWRDMPRMELLQGPNPRQCRRSIEPGEPVICLDCLKGGLDHLANFQPEPLPEEPRKKYDPIPGLRGGKS